MDVYYPPERVIDDGDLWRRHLSSVGGEQGGSLPKGKEVAGSRPSFYKLQHYWLGIILDATIVAEAFQNLHFKITLPRPPSGCRRMRVRDYNGSVHHGVP